MRISMQMMHNTIKVAHLLTVKKPADMHSTQQTIAQLERRGGVQGYGGVHMNYNSSKTRKVVKILHTTQVVV